MTTLAVRATSVKNSNDMHRVSDIRFMVLRLPNTQMFSAENDINDYDAKELLESFKKEYSTAQSVDQQLSAVNKLISHSSRAEGMQIDVLYQMLADLYFTSPLKHPLRNILVKTLHKESTKNRADVIIKSLSNVIAECNNTICESLKENENAGKTKFDDLSWFIASLNGCFDNFAEASVATKLRFECLLKSIHQFIDLFIRQLQSKYHSSPSRRSEIFIDLHNAIRFVLFGIQQFHEISESSMALEPILRQCWHELLENPAFADSPIDTKINCGILKVHYDRLIGQIFIWREKTLLQFDEIDEKNRRSITTNAVPVPAKSIFYGIAIINTMDETDLIDPDFYSALRAIVGRLIEVGKIFTIDSCLIMAVTRSLVQCSKRILFLLRKISLPPSITTTAEIDYLRAAMQECLAFVWINVHHSVDCVRYLSKDLLKNLLKLGQEQSHIFSDIVNQTIQMAKSSNTSETLICLLLDYLGQVFGTEFVLGEIPDIQQRILRNLFSDSGWAICYEHLMSKNCEIDHVEWCNRWIQPLMQVDANEWKNDFDHLKIIRNMFERALKTKPEAAEYILANPNLSIEIYLFVLWIMRRSGRKIYAPENYCVASDRNVIYAKVHPTDEIRILAFRILIECHKTSAPFTRKDFDEILEFFRYNCNDQSPSIRQQMNTTMKRAMLRIECGYSTAKRQQQQQQNPCKCDQQNSAAELCKIYEQFLKDLIEFCVEFCLFDGANFGRRATGLAALLSAIDMWQKLIPENMSIYTEKLWLKLQKTLTDSYVINKDAGIAILRLCWKFYPNKMDHLIYNLDDLKKLITTFRPYDVMTAAHYLVFCGFSQIYFDSFYDVVIWCEKLLDDGLAKVKKSLLQTARYNALYGLVLTIRNLLKCINFTNFAGDETERSKWCEFFTRIIPKCKELTDVAAPVVNSSAPEGHLPNDLNDVSHYLSITNDDADEETIGHDGNGIQIKVTAQMILLCAWRTVRESALLLGEIALHIPILTTTTQNGFVTIDQLLCIGSHFQQLLIETKHRGAFEQSFLGFSNLCLRLWRAHEIQLHSYPMKLVQNIAAIVSGGSENLDKISELELDVKKLCATRRSAGVPFMIQAVVMTETQVCSNTALTFCMQTFMNIAKTGLVEESRTHSLNILRSLFRCAELGDAVSEYISDGIECSIRGYSAASWPERNSSTLLFSALMVRTFGVPRTKEFETLSMKNKMTGRLFFIRYPRLYDFFHIELKLASEAIERNERPPRLHPLLLLISRLYPSALEGSDSNLKLSAFVPYISICSSSPELVTRQLSAKSMVALIPLANVAEKIIEILNEINTNGKSLNSIHGYLLQILYLLRSSIHQHQLGEEILNDITRKLGKLKLPPNNVIRKTFLEVLLEILLSDRMHPIGTQLLEELVEIRNEFVDHFSRSNQYGQLTQSYVQKPFTIFNLLISSNCMCGNDGNTISKSQTIPISIANTQNELIETQLNVEYLLLNRSSVQNSDANHDFSRYEVQLVRYFDQNEGNRMNAMKLLPSIQDLYYIVDHSREFYPFGVIKAYEILSMLITLDDAMPATSLELKRLTINELEQVIEATNQENDVDDVSEAMWKYVIANLNHCKINSSNISSQQISKIILHLRGITNCYKSSNLRQTATEVLAAIMNYFKYTQNLALLIEFSELLLSLLRDDDAHVRNRTSGIAMDLICEGNIQNKSEKEVIPLAAEDHFMKWLNKRFIEMSEDEAWSAWLHLLRSVYSPQIQEAEQNTNAKNAANNLIDVEIFDDTEANIFDETIYTAYRCFNFMLRNMNNCTSLDAQRKEKILSEYSNLKKL